VRNLAGRERGAAAEIHGLVGRYLAHGEREARLRHPRTECVREPIDERRGSRGPDHLEGRRARGEPPVPPGEDEGGQVGDVVGVKVGERDVGDPPPVQVELREPARHPAPAVHQQPHRPGLHQVPRARAPLVERDRPGAEGGEAHSGN
jgi:hypothetical protein